MAHKMAKIDGGEPSLELHSYTLDILNDWWDRRIEIVTKAVERSRLAHRMAQAGWSKNQLTYWNNVLSACRYLRHWQLREQNRGKSYNGVKRSER